MSVRSTKILYLLFTYALVCMPTGVFAATLRLSPDTGVYVQGNTFTTNVSLNTEGAPVNAADAELSFNPRELAVVSVAKGSLFSLWTLEPTFSNSLGTVSFGGGSPTGYTGKNGTILTITWRSLVSGTPKISWKSGSVLAADGMGTNVLGAMNGGSYTIDAKTNLPAPEYIPPPNTPAPPEVTSDTHPHEGSWYKGHTAHFTWDVPSGVLNVRTAFDRNPLTIPTVVYDEPIREKTIDDIEEGVSYFHIQFKNADGWGRVTHFKIQVDNTEPSAFTITETTLTSAEAVRTFRFDVEDMSPVDRYTIILDGAPGIEWKRTNEGELYHTEALPPSDHTLVVTAYDSAGHSRTATLTFTVASLPPPRLTEYPDRFPSSVTPLFRGEALPLHDVVATIESSSGATVYDMKVMSDAEGKFVLIPPRSFETGIYDITLRTVDQKGAQSESSDPARFVVDEPGYVVIGTFAIRILSLLVPIVALILVLLFGTWFLWHRLSLWQRKVREETLDAETKLEKEFALLVDNMRTAIEEIKKEKRGKPTARELLLFNHIEDELHAAERRLKKELVDIENIVE